MTRPQGQRVALFSHAGRERKGNGNACEVGARIIADSAVRHHFVCLAGVLVHGWMRGGGNVTRLGLVAGKLARMLVPGRGSFVGCGRGSACHCVMTAARVRRQGWLGRGGRMSSQYSLCSLCLALRCVVLVSVAPNLDGGVTAAALVLYVVRRWTAR